MPIYEFYCRDCHTLYSFFSRRINTADVPACPRGRGHRLTREVSAFASPVRREGGDGGAAEADGPPMDDPRVERAMDMLAGEAADMADREDPRRAAALMRRFSEMTGMKWGDGMEEAMRRLAAGEDPEAVEAELGDRLEGDDPLAPKEARGARRRPPARDRTLYEM